MQAHAGVLMSILNDHFRKNGFILYLFPILLSFEITG